MKREIAKNVIAAIAALFIIIAPAVLTWVVDTFVDFITK